MSWSEAMLGIAVTDGLLAQRKLDGDMSIIAPDDPQVLHAIVTQGKMAVKRASKELTGGQDRHTPISSDRVSPRQGEI